MDTNDHSSFYDETEGAEPLEQYCPGGLPVININQNLKQGQYKILHKLGHGARSTVWLASCRATDALVAIKALTAAASENSQEATFLSRLTGHKGIRQLLDTFIESGPNGQHRYLVMEPALCSVLDVREASYLHPLSLRVARSVVAELVLTVQHLHANGVVHGDVHTGNILLRLPGDMRKMNADELYDKVGRPTMEAITSKDGKPLSPNVPTHTVWPAVMDVDSTDVSPTQHLPAMLSDFSESFQPSVEARAYAHTRFPLIPPESFFSKDGSATISFPSEIWTLGCTIIEIMGNGSLFETFWSSSDKLICEHVKTLGKLPEPWWTEWEARSKYFNSDATVRLPKNLPVDDNLEKRYEWFVARGRIRYKEETPGVEEKRAFLDMLGTMLVLEPSRRANIDQVVECEWMQKWALSKAT